MTLQPWPQIALTLLIGALISIPVGHYLARVVTDRTTFLDPVWDPVDNLIYRLIGQRICGAAMNWKSYTVHMLATNFVMAVMIYLVLVFQDYLPLNPLNFPGMEPMLAFNTTISFISNTDWQAYGGETTLSQFQPDGGDHISDVHLRHHRFRRGHGVHPGVLRHGWRRRSRQFLSRPDSVHHPHADAGEPCDRFCS